jgi:integrase
MSLYKRGGVYWYSFVFRKERVQKSTHQGDRKAAREMEAARKTKLAQEYQRRERRAGELGCQPHDLIPCLHCGTLFNYHVAVITPHGKFCGKSHRDQWEKDHITVPTLREFEVRFMDSVKTRCAEKPLTIEFYQSKFDRLLEFSPLVDCRLDQIDEGLIESYVQHRSKVVSPASVNREMATLRKALRLALKWNVIDRVPSFSLLSEDGRERTFVLSQPQEKFHLEFAPQPLHDMSLLMLDTGLRVGEACGAQWADIHLEPAPGAKFGYVHIQRGKTKKAKRNVPLTPRIRAMLETRQSDRKTRWVFPSEDGSGPVSRFKVRSQHQVLREKQKLSAEFVIHSLRHTYGTCLGEAGADAFTIMRLMGHSSVTISQRYVHPTPEALERAVERLEALNAQGRAALPGISQDRPALPTVLTTVEKGDVDSSKEAI